MRIALDVRIIAVFVMASAGMHMHLLAELQTAKAAVKTLRTPDVVAVPATTVNTVNSLNTQATTVNATKSLNKPTASTPAQSSLPPAATPAQSSSAQSSLAAGAGVPIHRVARERAQNWKFPVYWRGKRQNPLFTDGFKSQTGQDKTISEIFDEKPGFFVDLASNYAVDISNTFALEHKFGWDGLCIEANPIYWADLLDRRCQLVMAVAGDGDNDKVDFNFRAQGGKSGLIGAMFDNEKPRNGMGFHGMQRVDTFYSVSLATILDDMKAPTTINYLSLDIEGAELYVMEKFPFQRYKFLTLTVERPKKLREVLEANNYVYVKDHGEHGDELYFHRDIPEFDKLYAKYKGPSKTLKETVDFCIDHKNQCR